ncbi:MAG: GNAT family N-acetyltransferase [Maribacter sp.]
MDNTINFESLSREKYDTYIRVGIQAYNEHYLHLWPKGDSTPYLKSSFTNVVLEKEALDANTLLFLIYYRSLPVGILKITLSKSVASHTKGNALYVDKIYILKEYTGMDIGKKVLEFIVHKAKELGKKIIWLDTMQKGAALNFYLKNDFEQFGETKLPFRNAIEAEKPMYILIRKI